MAKNLLANKDVIRLQIIFGKVKLQRAWFENRKWQLAHGRTLTLGERAIVMGILNVTPDSFSDGGKYENVNAAVAHAKKMSDEGADIIDIGGESTRPNFTPIDSATEQQRILPIVKELAKTNIIISVDTYHSKTASAAIEAGAHIINDIWGCRKSPEIAEIVAQKKCGLVVMHNNRNLEDDSGTVQGEGLDIFADQKNIFAESFAILSKHNVRHEQYVLDPGFGFGKDANYNLALLEKINSLHNFAGCGLAVGTSRKRFLSQFATDDNAKKDIATAATSIYARLKGAAIFRVHDCAVNRTTLNVADTLIQQELAK